METESLVGREPEYDAVHRFIHERLLSSHCKSLFIFGACGCGKTSTILRAMRRVTHRPMACDKTAGGRRGTKRPRDDTTNAPAGAVLSPAFASLQELLGKGRRVQCHYVNCADRVPQESCDAIVSSFREAQPRMDAQSQQLLGHIEALPQRVGTSKRRGGGSDATRRLSALSSPPDGTVESSPAKKTAVRAPLHVLALDEVEYMRSGGRGFLTALAALSVEYASQLALVFISNQRELVHVPHTLLKELPFEAYSAHALERIGAAIVDNADFTNKEREQVRLSPGLISYIAKKAIHEFSGDVRQVSAMCRRLVYTAQQEMTNSAADSHALGSDATPQRRSTHSSSSSATAGAVPGGSSPASPAAVMTLAQSQKVLRGPAAVSDRVFEYVAGMPEQMLYVLSCLVVLTLRQRQDKQLAQVGVGGTASTVRRARADISPPSTEPGTFAMRAVHRLYTALMGQQRFPSMNATGLAAAIDGFADLGIISRPERRGNEELFSFNGTWSLESMQAALIARGEALRQERLDCGLDGSENRFSEVMRELKTIVGL